jgi:hypothetical protein
MLFSYFLPVVGGFIISRMKRRDDRDLAQLCWIGSLVNPLLIVFILGLVLMPVTTLYGSLSSEILNWGILLVFGVIFNWWAITGFMAKNKYRYFLPVLWFGLLGAVYAYYGRYKNDNHLRDNVGTFFFFQFILQFLLLFALG